MSYQSEVHIQDAHIGLHGRVLDGIEATARGAGPFAAVDVAVAYASRSGVRALIDRLEHVDAWAAASKRWLVSIDFGFTDPTALEALSALGNSEVRIPNGKDVLARSLAPRSTFHPKAYLFHAADQLSPRGFISGSANLSTGALTVSSELMTSQTWGSQLSVSENLLLRATSERYLDWFRAAWDRADPVWAILPSYSAERAARDADCRPPEDRIPIVRSLSSDPETKEVYGDEEINLASCSTIWIETGHLYENRGPGKPGNQLDMPRGSRVFFGFNASKVPINTVLGEIEIQIANLNKTWLRSVRFANNQMDKVNLPVPGPGSVTTYDQKILIFDRVSSPVTGASRFKLTITDADGLERRKAASSHVVDLAMNGGRKYGLLF